MKHVGQMPFSNSHIGLHQPYLDRSVHFNVEHTLSGRKQVSNLQPTRLYYVACSHIYKSCLYQKKYTKIKAVRYSTRYFSMCGPL